MMCMCVCVWSRVWGWCAKPGAIPSYHATWILLEWEVECIQVRWSNKSAGFVSFVCSMNIKHIKIIGGSEYVTARNLKWSAGQFAFVLQERRGDYLLEHVKHLGGVFHPEWLRDCNSKTRQQGPTPPHIFWPMMRSPSGPISNKYVSFVLMCNCNAPLWFEKKNTIKTNFERSMIHCFVKI